MSKWVATIGLETHVQLRTRTKIWCGCANAFGAPPNTLVCPVCLGYPGALPVLNRQAVKLTVQAGMMLNCTIGTYSKHDRKSYFYPDMPKNYQITQYDRPLCIGGHVPWRAGELAGEVRLNRIHLEEDVGKSIHFETCSGLDFNRAGTPLMEIVTEPDIHTPEEAVAYLEALIEILVAGGITDGNLEEGNVRCDLNVSVAPEGSSELGTKAEIKNMNTLRGVLLALRHEIARQIRVVEGGGVIVQETRRWDDVLGCTTSMRTKEDSHDYRYFPDPDLLPIVLSEADLDAWRKELPELPAARRDRFVSELGLPEYDAGVLVSEKAVGDYYEELVAMGISPKTASNWVMTEVLRARGESGLRLEDLPAASLAGLIRMLEQQKINRQQARQIFDLIPVEGGSPEEIAQKHGMSQVSDDGFIAALVEGVLTQHAGPVSDYLAGKQAAFQFLIGQAMRASKGSANPQVVREALTKRLESLKTESP